MNFNKWENILSEKLRKPLDKKRISRILKTDTEDDDFIEFFKSMILTGKLIELKSGKYGYSGKMNMLTGIIDIHPKGFGFVIPDDGSDDVYVPLHNIGIALDKDRVVVKILSNKKREGKIVNILERSTKKIAGTLKKNGKYFYLIPDDKKMTRNILIDNEIEDSMDGKKAVAEIIEFLSPKHNPLGRILEVLDYKNKVDLQGRLILIEHGFDEQFPANVIDEAEKIVFNSDNIGNRKDLRNEEIFTIDPVTAKDFDDAISIKKSDNGSVVVGVHIADVSYYVTPGSELDNEAYKRATSVYLIDKTVPMLPERLSNEICSLKENEDRFTLSCEFTVGLEGNVSNGRIFSSVIRSSRRFNYQEAQDIIDGKAESPHKQTLILMKDTAGKLREEYRKNGRIDFDTPETEILLDEDKNPVSVSPKQRLHTHMMIEDFMITANMIVAKHISDLNISSLYRIHEEPSEENLNSMRLLLKKFGIPVKKITPNALQSILESSVNSDTEFLIKEIILHSMKRAIYSKENKGHYGLGLQYYTHFTSPIRRYPDLIVHRILHRMFKGKKDALRNLELTAKHSSEREWAAQKAERNSVEIAKMTFLANSGKTVYNGIISSITPFGIFIMITDVIVEGLLRYRDMDDDFYQMQEDEMSVVGVHTKRKITVGDKVIVKILNITPERMTMDLSIESFASKKE